MLCPTTKLIKSKMMLKSLSVLALLSLVSVAPVYISVQAQALGSVQTVSESAPAPPLPNVKYESSSTNVKSENATAPAIATKDVCCDMCIEVGAWPDCQGCPNYPCPPASNRVFLNNL